MGTLDNIQESDDTKQNLVDSYEAVSQFSWNFDYEGSVDKVEALYKRAKTNQWNADDLDWDTVIDPSKPIVQRGDTAYSHMPFFKRLSQTQQETFAAHSTAQMLSQFLHGEQGAVMTAATVTHSVPDTVAKYYAATQTMDEARHVEVYDRYIKKLAIHYPMMPWLKQLIDVTLQTKDYRKVMIGMNMIVEGLALGAFNNMYRQTDEPLLKSITFNVMRDESRHVSFGHVFLTPLVAQLHQDEVEELAQFAFDGVSILVNGQSEIDPGFIQVLETSGIALEDFQAGMAEARELGIDMDLLPGQVHSVNDLMLPALVRAGLITPRTKELFAGIGMPVNEDLTILNSMEDAKSDMSVLNEAKAQY